ncbi:hypothetical protein M0813_27881 [Anaeramoeba flamelloides]|uniref:Uncharacterized protein n=1 Tax=Anaeramoeba flamelloides TaxID=1746091 RepID=A0ABQ8XXG5_9EUKA|nr:hypothetical protein M0813_27881 [Anaeramoeba flamelloides]
MGNHTFSYVSKKRDFRRYQSRLNNSRELICLVDSKGKFRFFNSQLVRFLRSGPNRHKKPNRLNDIKPEIQTHLDNLNNEECAKNQISIWSTTRTKMLCFYWQIYDSKKEIQWLYLSVTVVSVPKEIMFQIVCQLTERPSTVLRSSGSSSLSQNKRDISSINSFSNTNSVLTSNSNTKASTTTITKMRKSKSKNKNTNQKKSLSVYGMNEKFTPKLKNLSAISQTSSQNSLNSSTSSFSLSRNTPNKSNLKEKSIQQRPNAEYELEIEEKWDREVSKLKKLLRKSQMTEIERKGISSINHLQSIFNDSKQKNNHFIQRLFNKNRKLKIQYSRKYESLEEHLQRRLSGYDNLKNQYHRLLEENKLLKQKFSSYKQRKKNIQKERKEKNGKKEKKRKEIEKGKEGKEREEGKEEKINKY